MKILLISANTLTAPYPVYPLGLDYVARAVEDKHQVKLADMNSLRDDDHLGEIIRGFSPDILGISLRNIDNTDAVDPTGFIETYRKLIQKIRGYSNALIVLGGSGFTIFPKEILDSLNADYGIIGEGERLALLLDAIENNKDVATIPGVVTPHIRKPIPPPWNKKFSQQFHINHSHFGFYLKKGGMLNLQTKRGCKYNCIYCIYPYIEGHRQRFIDPTDVANTALRLQSAGAKYFFITDSVFNSNYSHNIAIAQAFKKAGVSIPWGAFFAPIESPADYFQIMCDAGLTHVELGTESLSNRVLSSYCKPFQVQHIFDTHQHAIDAGLNVAHYFLIGGPGENSETLNETLSNVDKLKKSVLFFFCGMRIYPHTKLYEMSVKEGQILKTQSVLEPVFYHTPSIDTDEIIRRVKNEAKNRPNWVIGSGGTETTNITAKLYRRGHIGPLWEYLIR